MSSNCSIGVMYKTKWDMFLLHKTERKFSYYKLFLSLMADLLWSFATHTHALTQHWKRIINVLIPLQKNSSEGTYSQIHIHLNEAHFSSCNLCLFQFNVLQLKVSMKLYWDLLLQTRFHKGKSKYTPILQRC